MTNHTSEPVAWMWNGLHGKAFGERNPFSKDTIEHQENMGVSPLFDFMALVVKDTRIAELEAELIEQCRINGMGAERELRLIARVSELEAELAAVTERIRIRDMEYGVQRDLLGESISELAAEREKVDALREALDRLVVESKRYHLKSNPIKIGMAVHNRQDAECCATCAAIAKAEVALAATEMKE